MSTSDEERCALIREVAYKLYKASSDWDAIGGDIAYLLWGISLGSWVDMHNTSNTFDTLMHALFPTGHAVWKYIGYGSRSTN